MCGGSKGNKNKIIRFIFIVTDQNEAWALSLLDGLNQGQDTYI
jgi:hypothetical protein